MNRVLFLDNFDSFSYNLVDEFRSAGAEVEVWRNDAPLERLLERAGHSDLVVLSPGPGAPGNAGAAPALVRRVVGRRPVFGVCMGLQLLAEALGGEVGPAPRQVHGKTGLIRHSSSGLFAGLRSPFPAGRYHSLQVSRMPDGFRATAWGGASEQRVLMAMEDSRRRLVGVQFHPESLLTRDGSRLIARVLDWARGEGGIPLDPPSRAKGEAAVSGSRAKGEAGTLASRAKARAGAPDSRANALGTEPPGGVS